MFFLSLIFKDFGFCQDLSHLDLCDLLYVTLFSHFGQQGYRCDAGENKLHCEVWCNLGKFIPYMNCSEHQIHVQYNGAQISCYVWNTNSLNCPKPRYATYKLSLKIIVLRKHCDIMARSLT